MGHEPLFLRRRPGLVRWKRVLADPRRQSVLGVGHRPGTPATTHRPGRRPDWTPNITIHGDIRRFDQGLSPETPQKGCLQPCDGVYFNRFKGLWAEGNRDALP